MFFYLFISQNRRANEEYRSCKVSYDEYNPYKLSEPVRYIKPTICIE